MTTAIDKLIPIIEIGVTIVTVNLQSCHPQYIPNQPTLNTTNCKIMCILYNFSRLYSCPEVLWLGMGDIPRNSDFVTDIVLSVTQLQLTTVTSSP